MTTKSTTKKLKDVPLAWAEEYRGSGRLTGRLSSEPDYDASGEVAPGWRYVGDMTQDEFDRKFEFEQHDYCHSRDNADWGCDFCVDAGWIEEVR